MTGEGRRLKGNAAENDVCRALSSWLVPRARGVAGWETADTRDLPFRRRTTSRTPISGHWDGQGDLLHRPYINFPFCVECKNDASYESMDGLVAREKWPVWVWWEQAEEQARLSGLFPLLVFTKPRFPYYVLMYKRVADYLSVRPVEGSLLTIECPKKENRNERFILCLLNDLTKTKSVNVSHLYDLIKKGNSRIKK